MIFDRAAFAALVAAAGVALPAHAQMLHGGWYADVGAGQAKLKDDAAASDRKTAWTARLGARFHPNFAVDADYVDLGKYDVGPTGIGTSGGTVKASAWGASLVAIAPLDRFDIYGRIGYARTEVKTDTSVPGVGSFSASEKRNEAFYGVGGRYNRAGFGVFVEWNKHDKADIDYWLLGVQARF